ncbi:MAG: TPM domain-containing protein [Clostridiaceae bacterium]|nr:TPM domain-containing protein [Clostridiaceae bacterium]
MKKARKAIGILIFFCLTIPFWGTRPASAKTVIADGAQLLSTDELGTLEESCDRVEDRFDTSVYIIISQELGETDDYKSYVNQIAKDEKSPENLIILLLSVKSDDPFCFIKCYGNPKKNLTQKRCSSFAAQVEKYAAQDNAYDGLEQFVDNVLEYINRKPSLDGLQYHTMLHLLFAVLLGFLTLWILCGRRPAPVPAPQIDKDRSHRLGQMDLFMHSTSDSQSTY